ncbi:inactive leucine-rich repeat receptor kinase-like [Raphidocelis subcapitata]|uniref:Inactive leucine-rich repeat receptor kinase-like n=1 Tax=Raphidocelis subcapitata TaxID=307507 RepID=A0A2V0P8H5_9CHLO|nr:inactive leucine-rich repeat receptor kinase-like [Raphidocelis subcapitata]|eukprot:GBF96164.1 inactive leucine-rich repeat receptor kinase-like [Raphidocelis subcapitata]
MAPSAPEAARCAHPTASPALTRAGDRSRRRVRSGVRRAAALLAALLVPSLLVLLAGAAPASAQQQGPSAGAAAAPVSGGGAGGLRPDCPGLVSSPGAGPPVCGSACQQAVCGALARFHLVTSGEQWGNHTDGDSWPHDGSAAGCAAWLTGGGAADGGMPRYCNGVDGLACCSPADDAVLPEPCPFSGAPTNLSLFEAGLRTPVASPELWDALDTLMLCGLRRAVLQSNWLSGPLPEKLPASAAGWLKALDMGENVIEGTLPASWAQQLSAIETLVVSRNRLVGSIPKEWAQMRALRSLFLGANAVDGEAGLTGTIPPEIASLPNLTRFSVKSNSLHGTLPRELCAPRAAGPSLLEALHVSSNGLVGTVEWLVNCRRLITVDLSSNNFTGTLPNTVWDRLTTYDLGSCDFEGKLPDRVFLSPLLTVAKFDGNRLTGVLPNTLSSPVFLSILTLTSNNLTGEIGQEIFSLPSVEELQLDFNDFTSITPNVTRALSLRYLVLNNNPRLSGPIPDGFGALAALQVLRVDRTAMRGVPHPLAARELASGVRAPPGMTLPPAGTWGGPRLALPCFLRQLRDNYTPQLKHPNMACPAVVWARNFLAPGSRPRMAWSPDCPAGLPAPEPMPRFVAADIDPSYYGFQLCACTEGYQLVELPGLTALNGEPLMHCELLPRALEPWVRRLIAGLCVSMGALLLALAITAGVAAWQRAAWRPLVARRAALMVKRARGPPRGEGRATVVVTDIEGYSDLMKVMPEAMTPALAIHNQIMRRAAHANAGSVFGQEGDSYTIVFHEPFDASVFCLQVQLALQHADWGVELPAPHLLRLRDDSGTVCGSEAGCGSANGSASLGSEPHGARAGAPPAPRPGRGAPAAARRQSSGLAGAAQPARSAAAIVGLLLPQPGKARGLFAGPRVRMGVATADMAPRDLGSHYDRAIDLAKTVSELASGGQVFLDAASFEGVKQRLTELGAVNSRGLDRGGGEPGERRGCLGWARGAYTVKDAVALDMGEWQLPGLGQLPQPGKARGPPTAAHSAAAAAAAAPLRVYQLLAPSLCARAHVFANRVSLPIGARCLDLPYFDAPDTLHADLRAAAAPPAPLAGAPPADPLPRCAWVFVGVEGAPALLWRNRALAARAHAVLCDVLLAALRCLPGGYIARRGPDLKYLIAFYEAADALRWCLLVQEAALLAPWPEPLLRLPGFSPVADARGQLLFRGPRLKMGVAEGAPRCVLPDHAGRADYHGAEVNQAARYMDAAAHGGMVVADAELLRAAFAAWAGGGAGGGADVPAGCDVARAAQEVARALHGGGGGAAAAGEAGQRGAAASAAVSRQPSHAIPSPVEEGAAEGADDSSEAQGTDDGAQQQGQQGQQDQQQQAQEQPNRPGSCGPGPRRKSRLRSAPQQLARLLTTELAELFPGADPSGQLRAPSTPLEAAAFAELEAQAAARAAQADANGEGGAALWTGGSEERGAAAVLAGKGSAGSSDGSVLVPTVRVPWRLLQTSGPLFLDPAAFTFIPTPVIAGDLGRFKFKGTAVLEMGAITTERLAARRFPPEPPGGKGARVAAGGGPPIASATVQLPALLPRLHAEFEKARTAAAAAAAAGAARSAAAAAAPVGRTSAPAGSQARRAGLFAGSRLDSFSAAPLQWAHSVHSMSRKQRMGSEDLSAQGSSASGSRPGSRFGSRFGSRTGGSALVTLFSNLQVTDSGQLREASGRSGANGWDSGDGDGGGGGGGGGGAAAPRSGDELA